MEKAANDGAKSAAWDPLHAAIAALAKAVEQARKERDAALAHARMLGSHEYEAILIAFAEHRIAVEAHFAKYPRSDRTRHYVSNTAPVEEVEADWHRVCALEYAAIREAAKAGAILMMIRGGHAKAPEQSGVVTSEALP